MRGMPEIPRLAVTPSMQQAVLAEHTSPSLADDIRLANKNSENLHAELLLPRLLRTKR